MKVEKREIRSKVNWIRASESPGQCKCSAWPLSPLHIAFPYETRLPASLLHGAESSRPWDPRMI